MQTPLLCSETPFPGSPLRLDCAVIDLPCVFRLALKGRTGIATAVGGAHSWYTNTRSACKQYSSNSGRRARTDGPSADLIFTHEQPQGI